MSDISTMSALGIVEVISATSIDKDYSDIFFEAFLKKLQVLILIDIQPIRKIIILIRSDKKCYF
jgi:hypothetical protein